MRIDCPALTDYGPPAFPGAHGAGPMHRCASCAALLRSTEGVAGPEPECRKQAQRDKELATALAEMRLLKDADEVRALQSAVDATKRGFEDVIARLKTAEERARARRRVLDARADGRQRRRLHLDRRLRRARLHAALDAERRRDPQGRSAAARRRRRRATRSTPPTSRARCRSTASSRREQRAIYELVLEAQRAAFKMVKPGNDFMAPNQAAMRCSRRAWSASASCPCPPRRHCGRRTSSTSATRCTTSATCSASTCTTARKARAETYKYGKLEAGMVLTVEPGLYFQTDDLTVPAKYRGIGVRIEDDVLVTAKGHRVLSASLPSEPDEVEAWMRHIWQRDKRQR